MHFWSAGGHPHRSMGWSRAQKGRSKRQLRRAPGSAEAGGESLNHPLIDPNCPIHTLPLESRISREVSVEYASEEEDDEEEDDARESDSIRSMAEGTRQFGESAAGGSVAAGASRTVNSADDGLASRKPKKALALRFDHLLGAAAKRLGVVVSRRGRGMDSVLSPTILLRPPQLLFLPMDHTHQKTVIPHTRNGPMLKDSKHLQ